MRSICGHNKRFSRNNYVHVLRPDGPLRYARQARCRRCGLILLCSEETECCLLLKQGLMRSCIGSFRFDRSYLGFKSLHTNYKHPTKKKQSQILKRTRQSGRSSPPLEGLQGLKGDSVPLSLPQERNPPRRSSAQGEFENSPADCFQRGASPAIEGCPLLAYRTNSPARACPLRCPRADGSVRDARQARCLLWGLFILHSEETEI